MCIVRSDDDRPPEGASASDSDKKAEAKARREQEEKEKQVSIFYSKQVLKFFQSFQRRSY